MTTQGKLVVGIVGALLAFGGWYAFEKANAPTAELSTPAQTFSVNGIPITLVDGKSEIASSNSAAVLMTTYFGNDVKGDFNEDGKEDTAFLVTQTTGGSGTFYYLATSLGGEAAFLGDRIAPQTTQWQDGKIIVNFAERKSGEPMTTAPSVGVSKYFEIKNGALVEVQAPTSKTDTSGNVIGTITISPTCPVERNPPDPACAPKAFVTEVSAFEKESQKMIAQMKTSVLGEYALKLPLGNYTIRAATTGTYPRCAEQTVSIRTSATITLDISCDSGMR